jgi:hypothetical protein
MNAPIEYLIEKDKIINVINKLFIQTDSRGWDNVKKCFADKVHFDMTSLGGGEPVTLTPQEIVDSWEAGLKSLEAIHHQTGNYKVDVKNNEAIAFCYGIALHHKKTKSGNNTRTFVGSYNFHLIKRENNWLIDSFKFNMKFLDGNPELEKDI